ncbi:M23 family metallopeptidase [Gynuella sp.]|uniref:M23 family metallopeptidase n=1 Tax=Gynuella sp. TaxID=2969146 RepID=UPI003D0F5C52
MKKKYLFAICILVLIVVGYCLPERIVIPVAGASQRDWNPKSFWYEPWGVSGVHKGIDIFGKTGTDVLSTTDGLVLYTGQIRLGGNVVLVLGPKWHLHYFAHLNTIDTSIFSVVASGDKIASLGDSGNAKGKPPHLHYSVVRMIPFPWKTDRTSQGYKKAFYLDPGKMLTDR